MSSLYKTYLINLKRSPERLAFMSEQFKKLGMDFELIEGVDAGLMTTDQLYAECDAENMKKHNKGKMLSNGEIGCALSHRHAVKKVAEGTLPYGLILEDDVELSPLFKLALENEIANREAGKTDWEYIAFNYPSVGWKSIALWLFLFKNMMKENRHNFRYWIKLPIYAIKFLAISAISFYEGLREFFYKKIYRYGKPTSFFRPLYLAGCYLMTKEGAKKLLTVTEKIIYPADRIQNVTRVTAKLKHRAFVPLLARQRREEFASILNNKHFGEKVISY